MHVRPLTPEWEPRYQDFVSRHPDGLFYASLRYRDFLVDLLGCRPNYRIATEGEAVVGVLPLMATDGSYGQVLNSLPYYGSNGGILAADDAARGGLADWYDDIAVKAEVAAATVIDNPLSPSGEGFPAHDLTDDRIGAFTDLVGPGSSSTVADGVLAAIDGSARRNIQKALRSGVTVDVENDAFASLRSLHQEGMDAIGGRPKSLRFFESIPDHFRPDDDYRIYIARQDGAVIAALLLFYFGTTVEYYMPCTALQARPFQPLAAVLFQSMTDAASHGFRRWNWGGTWTTQVNLLRFKTKWGGQPHPYRYWTKINNTNLLSAGADDLLRAYPGFFVVPFASLASARRNEPA